VQMPVVVAALLLYAAFASVFFFSYGLPSLNGEIPQQMYADTLTYETAALNWGEENELVAIDGNYLGPVTVLALFDHNRILVHAFNLILLVVSVAVALSRLEVNRTVFLLAFLSSPLLLFSTIGVNKEIFLVPLSLFLAVYMREQRLRWLLLSLVFAVLARWQLMVFVVALYMVNLPFNPLRGRRFRLLIMLLAAITVAYPILASGLLEAVEAISIEGGMQESGSASGIYPLMQSIQRSYGYFLVVVPKALQLLFGYLTRFSLEGISEDFWNAFVIMSQSAHNLLLLVLCLVLRKRRLANDMFFLICMFSIIFATTPVFGPRYFFPVGIWLALWLAQTTEAKADGARTMQPPLGTGASHA
jgi:hypothetical protein